MADGKLYAYDSCVNEKSLVSEDVHGRRKHDNRS